MGGMASRIDSRLLGREDRSCSDNNGRHGPESMKLWDWVDVRYSCRKVHVPNLSACAPQDATAVGVRIVAGEWVQVKQETDISGTLQAAGDVIIDDQTEASGCGKAAGSGGVTSVKLVS